MRILALETSSLHGSVAVATETQLIGERMLPRESRTARALAPAIEQILAEAGWPASTLDVVATTQGPGSFTGLRIGVTTAKTLAFAVNARVVGINTLQALALAAAEQVPEGQTILPLLDAHRGQLFATAYRRVAGDTVEAESEVEFRTLDTWLAEPTPAQWLTGPVLTKLAAEMQQRWPGVQLCDSAYWTPRASAVARLAQQAAANNQSTDPFTLLPQYYRPSYAEEKVPMTKPQ